MPAQWQIPIHRALQPYEVMARSLLTDDGGTTSFHDKGTLPMALLTIGRHTQIILTGGAGFIGAHLTRRLLTDGIRVTVLTRRAGTTRARELVSLGAVIVEGDLTKDLGESSRQALPSQALFFHFAADTSVEGPGVRAVNVEGTWRALELAERLDSLQFVFASSIEAQGPARDVVAPLSEAAPCRPVSAYGRSKLEAEALVSAWATRTGRKALTLRIGNTYGPGSPWLLPSFLTLCLGRASLPANWEELRHRTFQPLYVEDLVDAIVRSAAGRLEGVYNVTGDATISLDRYLDRLAGVLAVRELLPSKLRRPESPAGPRSSTAPDLAYFLMGDGEGRHRIYDNRRLQAAVGSYVRWSLPRGLAATLAWYRDSGHWEALLKAAHLQGEQVCTSH